MRISPIQLQTYLLDRVCIEPREESNDFRPVAAASGLQDWTGVQIQQGFAFGWAEGQEGDPLNFALRLRIRISNEDGVVIPYKVDVAVTGYFQIQKDVPRDDRDDMAKVNGASLLYGVIRDTVHSITTRSPLGPCILPTVNFLDLKAIKASASGPAK